MKKLSTENRFHNSQDDDYLNTCIQRVETIDLTWVKQSVDILEKKYGSGQGLQINDIGCNLGQFYKELKKRNIMFEYNGYDIEPIYLEEAKKIFPELSSRLFKLDITKNSPRVADITIISATLEHLTSLFPAMKNILDTTREMVIIRTFLGEKYEKSIRKKELADTYYYINQYSFLDMFEIITSHNFQSKIIRDEYTDSLPQFIDQGIIRSFFIIIGERNGEDFQKKE